MTEILEELKRKNQMNENKTIILDNNPCTYLIMYTAEDFAQWLLLQGTIATEADKEELLQGYIKACNNWYEEKVNKRMKELTSKIPVGTYCSDSNNCGGFLTAQEADELEMLMGLGRSVNPAPTANQPDGTIVD